MDIITPDSINHEVVKIGLHAIAVAGQLICAHPPRGILTVNHWHSPDPRPPSLRRQKPPPLWGPWWRRGCCFQRCISRCPWCRWRLGSHHVRPPGCSSPTRCSCTISHPSCSMCRFQWAPARASFSPVISIVLLLPLNAVPRVATPISPGYQVLVQKAVSLYPSLDHMDIHIL